jgi:pimeloyl-ACP methyl ester carboxylesterase
MSFIINIQEWRNKKMNIDKTTTIVTVPCFSGAPWDLKQLKALKHRPLRTMRLPEGLDDIENYVDFVEDQVSDLNSYVIVGDSFGAIVALAFATRKPKNLDALVISGGFATNPVTNPFLKMKIRMAKFFPGPLYRALTLRFHAASLESPYDNEGQELWSKDASYDLFLKNTPYRSYVARSKAAFSADYVNDLYKINVPTLIITPSYDRLIGEHAAIQMLHGIPDATEVVIPRTGHMFRFSHPVTYSETIEQFIQERIISRKQKTA